MLYRRGNYEIGAISCIRFPYRVFGKLKWIQIIIMDCNPISNLWIDLVYKIINMLNFMQTARKPNCGRWWYGYSTKLCESLHNCITKLRLRFTYPRILIRCIMSCILLSCQIIKKSIINRALNIILDSNIKTPATTPWSFKKFGAVSHSAGIIYQFGKNKKCFQRFLCWKLLNGLSWTAEKHAQAPPAVRRSSFTVFSIFLARNASFWKISSHKKYFTLQKRFSSNFP